MPLRYGRDEMGRDLRSVRSCERPVLYDNLPKFTFELLPSPGPEGLRPSWFP